LYNSVITDEENEDTLDSVSNYSNNSDDEDLSSLSTDSSYSLPSMYNSYSENNEMISMEQLIENFAQLKMRLANDPKFQTSKNTTTVAIANSSTNNNSSNNNNNNNNSVTTVTVTATAATRTLEASMSMSRDFCSHNFIRDAYHDPNDNRHLLTATASEDCEKEQEDVHSFIKQLDTFYVNVKLYLKRVAEMLFVYVQEIAKPILKHWNHAIIGFTDHTLNNNNNNNNSNGSNNNNISCAEKIRAQEEIDSILEDALYEIDDYLTREDPSDYSLLSWTGVTEALFSSSTIAHRRNNNGLLNGGGGHVLDTNDNSSSSSSSSNNNNSNICHNHRNSNSSHHFCDDVDMEDVGSSNSVTRDYSINYGAYGSSSCFTGIGNPNGWYIFKDSHKYLLNSFFL